MENSEAMKVFDDMMNNYHEAFRDGYKSAFKNALGWAEMCLKVGKEFNKDTILIEKLVEDFKKVVEMYEVEGK